MATGLDASASKFYVNVEAPYGDPKVFPAVAVKTVGPPAPHPDSRLSIGLSRAPEATEGGSGYVADIVCVSKDGVSMQPPQQQTQEVLQQQYTQQQPPQMTTVPGAPVSVDFQQQLSPGGYVNISAEPASMGQQEPQYVQQQPQQYVQQQPQQYVQQQPPQYVQQQPMTTHVQQQLPQSYETTSYVQPQTTYVQPQTTYAQPQTTYVQPQTTYTQPQTTFVQPQTTYTQPQATTTYAEPQYVQPSTTYAHAQPQVTFSQPQATYSQPQATYSQPQATYSEPQTYNTQQPVQPGNHAIPQEPRRPRTPSGYGPPPRRQPAYGSEMMRRRPRPEGLLCGCGPSVDRRRRPRRTREGLTVIGPLRPGRGQHLGPYVDAAFENEGGYY
eukprot:GHVU01081146.1.p1 GENE.GHVU01081146.1~~GHVU01081146.1.p1  ORF type:complete len:384 (+),score=48.52 GHVU01081146.1:422-1573(+)